MKNLEKLFKEIFNQQITKRNQKAVNEGIKIMKEIHVIKIPSATSQERIDYTIYSMMNYVDKWAA